MKHLIKVHLSGKGQRRITLPTGLTKGSSWVKARYVLIAGGGDLLTVEPVSPEMFKLDESGKGGEVDHGGADG